MSQNRDKSRKYKYKKKQLTQTKKKHIFKSKTLIYMTENVLNIKWFIFIIPGIPIYIQIL